MVSPDVMLFFHSARLMRTMCKELLSSLVHTYYSIYEIVAFSPGQFVAALRLLSGKFTNLWLLLLVARNLFVIPLSG
jgi:hypothetical protein